MIDSVKIGALAIASICDSYTRNNLGATPNPSSYPIFGILFGIVEGGADSFTNIKIVDAYDLPFTIVNDRIVVNSGDILSVRDLVQRVFPTYSAVGWYTSISSTSTNISYNRYFEIQNTFCSIIADPIAAILSPNAQSDEIPVKIFTFMKENDDAGFVSIPFDLESSEIEQISVNAITKCVSQTGSASIVASNASLSTSIGELQNNILVICDSLMNMRNKKIPINRKFLRDVGKINALLGKLGKSDYQAESQQLNEDTLVMALLESSTKVLADLSAYTQLIESMNVC